MASFPDKSGYNTANGPWTEWRKWQVIIRGAGEKKKTNFMAVSITWKESKIAIFLEQFVLMLHNTQDYQELNVKHKVFKPCRAWQIVHRCPVFFCDRKKLAGEHCSCNHAGRKKFIVTYGRYAVNWLGYGIAWVKGCDSRPGWRCDRSVTAIIIFR